MSDKKSGFSFGVGNVQIVSLTDDCNIETKSFQLPKQLSLPTEPKDPEPFEIKVDQCIEFTWTMTTPATYVYRRAEFVSVRELRLYISCFVIDFILIPNEAGKAWLWSEVNKHGIDLAASLSNEQQAIMNDLVTRLASLARAEWRDNDGLVKHG